MLNILKDNIDNLGITASTSQFDDTLSRLTDALINSTASIEITSTSTSRDKLILDLQISQTVGHKMPTGFPSRRAWIHLVVTDAHGNTVFESGKSNGDGSITGCDADQNPSTYEPHYDVINSTDQVQIYEAVMGNVNDDVTYTLLCASQYLKDNRLLPLGFDKENAVEKIAVRGEAATDESFIGGSDQIEYQIDTQDFCGPFTVKVELLYQTISYRFVQDLLQDDSVLIDVFEVLYQQADKTPTCLAVIEQTIG
jgi:hypothetical protein